jgi:hypothetical protein
MANSSANTSIPQVTSLPPAAAPAAPISPLCLATLTSAAADAIATATTGLTATDIQIQLVIEANAHEIELIRWKENVYDIIKARAMPHRLRVGLILNRLKFDFRTSAIPRRTHSSCPQTYGQLLFTGPLAAVVQRVCGLRQHHPHHPPLLLCHSHRALHQDKVRAGSGADKVQA